MAYTIIDHEQMLDELLTLPRGRMSNWKRASLVHIYKRHANLWSQADRDGIEAIWNKVFNP